MLLTGKHLWCCLFLVLSIAKFLRAPILKNICVRLLLKTCSWKWEKLRFVRSFNLTLKNQVRGKFPPGKFPPIKLPPGIFPPILLSFFTIFSLNASSINGRRIYIYILPGWKILICPERLNFPTWEKIAIIKRKLTMSCDRFPSWNLSLVNIEYC